MAITAASIEANGWVLRLTMTAAPGSFASYALDPNGAQRVQLTTSHPGFARSGGQAVAAPLLRTLMATRPLRLPVSFASPSVEVIDEVNLGGGQVQVRLALSQHVYQTDSGLTLNVAAGWRTGLPAQAGIAVTNGSTLAAPVPIMRWALRPYATTSGPFRVALLAFSHHPQGFDPVAGVRFTATDGTTTRSVWVTAQDTDPSLGDGLRCYTAVIDPAGLNAGLLRVDAEVHPWLGAMRSTDPAGTRSMTSLRTDGYGVAAQSPWVIGHDPGGSRYGQMWVYLDPVAGISTASAAMIGTSLAAAKAVAPAARARDLATAIQAGHLANRTLPAANGQASQTRSVDGLTVVLAPGTHVHGANAVTSGTASAEIPVRIIGDPDDANPRANCVFNTSVAVGILRISRAHFENLTIGLGVNALISTTYTSFDRVTLAGRAGQETNGTGVLTPSPPAGQWNVCVTRSRVWRFGSSLPSGSPRCGLYRASEHSRPVQALTYVANRFIGQAEDGFVTGTPQPVGSWASPTLVGQGEDIVIAWNDLRFLRGRAIGFTYVPAAVAGTSLQSMRRHAVIGNVMEKLGNDPQPFYSMGEDISATMSYNIIEYNSCVGERTNGFYSDPLPAVLADCDTQANQAFVNRVANNAFDWLPTKHDEFLDPQTNALRAGTGDAFKSGYRPQMVEAWSNLYGVGHEGNVCLGRSGGGSFVHQFYGLRSLGNAGVLNPQWSEDRSVLGNNTGGGNYAPLAGSILNGRVQSGNGDRDRAGVVRAAGSAAGAFNGPLVAAATISPANARSGHVAATPALALRLALGPAGAAMPQRAGTAAAGWQATLLAVGTAQPLASGTPAVTVSFAVGPAGSVHPSRAVATATSWQATLAVAGARSGSRAASTIVIAAGAIVPAAARMPMSDAGQPLLLPGQDLTRLNALPVRRERREVRVTPH